MAIALRRMDRVVRFCSPSKYRRAAAIATAILLSLIIAVSPRCFADDTAAFDPRQLAASIAELDSDQFYIRARAAENLERLSMQPAAQRPLADALGQLMLSTETTYEVRLLCAPILARLPATAGDRPHWPSTADEVDLLVAQVDGATYAERTAAAERLLLAARARPALAPRIAEKLKQRLADPELSADCRRRIAEVREAAWIEWLSTDPVTWPTPTATATDAAVWIDTLASDRVTHLAAESAERDLTDLMVYDAMTPQIRTLLDARLKAADLAPAAIERLTRLHELSHPALAAEIWQDHFHITLQYLLVDVPQYPEGMPRATHFDAINDTTAHCVSGNSLAPGDYPVGIAVPPTRVDIQEKQGRMFHIVNLPTPRQRLLYDHRQLQVDEAQRLRDLSERTADWMLKRKECLSEREIAMLRQLDPDVVSRFAGDYFLAVEDEPKPANMEFADGGTSRHAFVCVVLSEIGTHEALPGLVTSIRRGRLPGVQGDVAVAQEPVQSADVRDEQKPVLRKRPIRARESEPSSENRPNDPAPIAQQQAPDNADKPDAKPVAYKPEYPQHVGWLAALAIIERDPWPGLDQWLVDLVKDQSLLASPSTRATVDVGGTMAAILLSRHGLAPAEFGLVEINDVELRARGIPAARFSTPEARQQVLDWWKTHQERLKSDGA